MRAVIELFDLGAVNGEADRDRHLHHAAATGYVGYIDRSSLAREAQSRTPSGSFSPR